MLSERIMDWERASCRPSMHELPQLAPSREVPSGSCKEYDLSGLQMDLLGSILSIPL